MIAADDVASPGQHHRLGLVVGLLAALVEGQRHERRGILEHHLAHQLVRSLAHAEDIQEPPRLQFGHGLGTDHAAVVASICFCTLRSKKCLNSSTKPRKPVRDLSDDVRRNISS